MKSLSCNYWVVFLQWESVYNFTLIPEQEMWASRLLGNSVSVIQPETTFLYAHFTAVLEALT